MYSHLGLEGLLTPKSTESTLFEATKRGDSSLMTYRRGSEQTKIGARMPYARGVRRYVFFREKKIDAKEEKKIMTSGMKKISIRRQVFHGGICFGARNWENREKGGRVKLSYFIN